MARERISCFLEETDPYYVFCVDNDYAEPGAKLAFEVHPVRGGWAFMFPWQSDDGGITCSYGAWGTGAEDGVPFATSAEAIIAARMLPDDCVADVLDDEYYLQYGEE